MDWENFVNRFIFDYDAVVDEHIDPITCFDQLVIINYWLDQFALDLKTPFS